MVHHNSCAVSDLEVTREVLAAKSQSLFILSQRHCSVAVALAGLMMNSWEIFTLMTHGQSFKRTLEYISVLYLLSRIVWHLTSFTNKGKAAFDL